MSALFSDGLEGGLGVKQCERSGCSSRHEQVKIAAKLVAQHVNGQEGGDDHEDGVVVSARVPQSGV